MRQLLSGLLLMALAVTAVRADDKKSADTKLSKAGEELQALKKEYDPILKKFNSERAELNKQYQATKDKEERKELLKKLQEQMADDPGPKFAPRFLAIAEKSPSDPAAIDAIIMALRNCRGPRAKNGVFAGAVALLQKEFVKAPEVKRVLPILANSGDDAAQEFVRDVLEKNPNRVTQARAATALLNVAEDAVESAARLKKDKELREKVELQRGKEYVEKVFAKGEKAHSEQRELESLVRGKYRDIIPDLSAGKKAPELLGHDIDGKPVKLSDYRGKVVVLDIWATWCGPCKAMIPHEQEMVEKLKGKPFALISVSADEEKQALVDFLAKATPKQKMPWTHWWNGNDGGVVEEWNVRFYPSIYVIDAKGTIRLNAKGFIDNMEERDDKLADLVDDLLKEVDEKKGSN
jgi:thiol-disulfide isomerase/thioredoxin